MSDSGDIGDKSLSNALLKERINAIKSRTDEIENDLEKLRGQVSDLKHTTARTEERLIGVQSFLDTMRSDTRTIRNTVISALVTGLLIAVAGLAMSGHNSQHIENLITNRNSIGKR